MSSFSAKPLSFDIVLRARFFDFEEKVGRARRNRRIFDS
jgi:hypothetical protein